MYPWRAHLSSAKIPEVPFACKANSSENASCNSCDHAPVPQEHIGVRLDAFFPTVFPFNKLSSSATFNTVYNNIYLAALRGQGHSAALVLPQIQMRKELDACHSHSVFALVRPVRKVCTEQVISMMAKET